MKPNDQIITRLTDTLEEAQARLDAIQSESLFLMRSISTIKATLIQLRALDNPTAA
ncbi:MAG: hypothetical protein ACRYG4_04300 [Janthinobacterium lividum]